MWEGRASVSTFLGSATSESAGRGQMRRHRLKVVATSLIWRQKRTQRLSLFLFFGLEPVLPLLTGVFYQQIWKFLFDVADDSALINVKMDSAVQD